jgi:hypothetical protein
MSSLLYTHTHLPIFQHQIVVVEEESKLSDECWLLEMSTFISSLVTSHNDIKPRFLRKVYKAIHEIRQEVEKANLTDSMKALADPQTVMSLSNLHIALDQITNGTALARTLPDSGPKSTNALYMRYLLESLHTALQEFCSLVQHNK